MQNLRVGLLDGDIYGPSVPKLMGFTHQKPFISDKSTMIALKIEKILPLVNHGVKCMSIGLLVREDAAIAWRGLMA